MLMLKIKPCVWECKMFSSQAHWGHFSCWICCQQSHLMSFLARHPAVCSGLHPLGKPMSRSRGVEIKVQRSTIHEGLIEDGVHVTFKAFDGHAVQVAGQPLLMVAVGMNWVQLFVAVAWRSRICVCWESVGQLHARLQAGHLSRGPWKTSKTSQGNCITGL